VMMNGSVMVVKEVVVVVMEIEGFGYGGLVKVEDGIVMVLWLFLVVEVMNVVVYGG
jgi:hypothetical protein